MEQQKSGHIFLIPDFIFREVSINYNPEAS